MKKVISLIIAAVMLFSIPVHASSYASLNKVKTVRDDVMISDQYLKITPRDEVETGSSIIISFTNAKVTTQTQIDGMYQYSYYDWKGSSEGFWDVMPKVKTNELPYKIKRVGQREIQVSLINLPKRYADGSIYSVNGATGRPVYNIRLPIISDGSGDIKIIIDNNDSTISRATLTGNYVWTKGGAESSSYGLTDTEGADGEILEETTVETTTETTTQAASQSGSSGSGSGSSSDEYSEDEEIDIFDMDYNELIAVKDLSDILTEEDELSYIDWDSNTKTVTISYKGNILQFISDSDYYILNDEIIYFKTVEDEETDEEVSEDGGSLVTIATIINKRMYVPVGVVIDALGLGSEEEETTELTTEETTEEVEEAAEAAEETTETEDLTAEETTDEAVEA